MLHYSQHISISAERMFLNETLTPLNPTNKYRFAPKMHRVKCYSSNALKKLQKAVLPCEPHLTQLDSRLMHRRVTHGFPSPAVSPTCLWRHSVRRSGERCVSPLVGSPAAD